MIEYFERILRFKDLEVWDVRFTNEIYRVFIMDENRPPTMNDFPVDVQPLMDEDDLRKNLVTVRIYSEQSVKDEHIEYLAQFYKQLTDFLALAHCNVIVSFYTGNIDEALNDILIKNYNLRYDEIPLQKLMHLNQDIK